MGKIVSTFQFVGKVGNAVGMKGENGIPSARIWVKPSNPRTPKQMQQRTKMALMAQFCSRIGGFLRAGFNDSRHWFAKAVKTNIHDVIGGTYPAYELLYNKFLVSNGLLELPYSPSAVIDSQSLNVSWTDNSGIGFATGSDDAMLLVYNSAKGQAVYRLDAGKREDRQGAITLPTAWSGDSVDVWMAMRSSDTTRTSESVYLGNFSI